MPSLLEMGGRLEYARDRNQNKHPQRITGCSLNSASTQPSPSIFQDIAITLELGRLEVDYRTCWGGLLTRAVNRPKSVE